MAKSRMEKQLAKVSKWIDELETAIPKHDRDDVGQASMKGAYFAGVALELALREKIEKRNASRPVKINIARSKPRIVNGG